MGQASRREKYFLEKKPHGKDWKRGKRIRVDFFKNLHKVESGGRSSVGGKKLEDARVRGRGTERACVEARGGGRKGGRCSLLGESLTTTKGNDCLKEI